MEEKFKFTTEELAELQRIATHLKTTMGDTLEPDDENYLRQQLEKEISDNKIKRDVFGLNPILLSFQTAELELSEIGMKRECVLAILLYNSIINGILTLEEVERKFGHSVAQIIHGLVRIHELYQRTPIIESENFRNLLLSFAEDMRVILIMITDRVNLMRQIRDTPNKEAQSRVAEEASYLYAPLAHKLGLYKLKSELEDLSLKYLEHDAYYMIKDKLNATKRSRDAYIEKFIQPIDEKLKQMGINCHIKGRTKSIHSIWQKMKKQQCGFEGIYDLFAIRIIIDSPIDRRRCCAGRHTRSSLICISLTPNVCATGCLCLNRTATRVCTSRYLVRKTSGWRCKSEQNAWTRLPSVDWLLTGATRASRENRDWTNGWATYVRRSKATTICS